MSPLAKDFVDRIAHQLEDEETDIYTLTLYSMNSNDLQYFSPEDRKRVKKIFKILTDDTRRHAELLRLIVEMAGRA